MNMTLAPPSPQSLAARSLGWATRHPWLVLGVWAGLWSVGRVLAHGASWHYLVTGVHALFSAHPLSLYAVHPELQMGPLTFLVGAPFVLLLPGIIGEVAVMAFMLVIGLLILRELRTLSAASVSSSHWLAFGVLAIPVWTEVAVHWGHLDDALALYGAALGLRLIRTGHPFASAITLALAVDFKPWAAPFAALLLMAPRRLWIPVAALWVGVVAAAWLPFFIGDPTTVSALRFAIPIDTSSTLHLLGIPGRSTPSWDRYAQVGGAFVLAAIAIWRKRWAAVFLIIIVVRLLLDPGTKNYYDAGLILGAGVFDLSLSLTLLPYAAMAAFALVYVPSYALGGVPEVRGPIRTAALIGLLAAAFFLPMPTRTRAPLGRPGVDDPRPATTRI
jgi:hypothetical protein